MFKKLGLYFRTVKHLKPIQIRYRLWYILRNKIRNLTGHSYPLSIPKEGNNLDLTEGILSPTSSFQPPQTFTFLNQSHTFEETIAWNFSKYGKLWAYNLNYFDYLNKQGITKEDGLKLIDDFIDQVETNREGLEPYPISLRGINWIKFFVKHEIKKAEIDASLFAQYQILYDNIEHHLLGNHLLENGCSLLFGAYYFRDKELYDKAEQILVEQLEEQVLDDGGHFERSTMYHCILLERLMDCYNVVGNNDQFEATALKQKLKEKVELMLGWLEQLSVDSEQLTVPLLNDAASGMGPKVSELFDYAERLELETKKVELTESGYRKYSTSDFHIICDMGSVGPDYQPGHAHSDTLSFVLYHKGFPTVIDPGISTYENNDRRQLERSTRFHNTVQFNSREQTEVWDAFRVGRRAKIRSIEGKNIPNGRKVICASHDGYKPWDVVHHRCWEIDQKENKVIIEDKISGSSSDNCYFFLHFHPRLNNELRTSENTIRASNLKISFADIEEIQKETYNCPDGYNRYIEGTKFVVRFESSMTTYFTISP